MRTKTGRDCGKKGEEGRNDGGGSDEREKMRSMIKEVLWWRC